MVSYVPRDAMRLGRRPEYLRGQRQRAQQALQAARRLDPDNEQAYIAIYSDVMQKATKARDAHTSEVMFRRLAIALEVMADRIGWPHHIAGL
jgi:hypothetical protein